MILLMISLPQDIRYLLLDLAALEAHLDPSPLFHPMRERERERMQMLHYLSNRSVSALCSDVEIKAYLLAHLLVLLVPLLPVRHAHPEINQPSIT